MSFRAIRHLLTLMRSCHSGPLGTYSHWDWWWTVIKEICVTAIFCRRWEPSMWYNNTNNTHTHALTPTHMHSHPHTCMSIVCYNNTNNSRTHAPTPTHIHAHTCMHARTELWMEAIDSFEKKDSLVWWEWGPSQDQVVSFNLAILCV